MELRQEFNPEDFYDEQKVDCIVETDEIQQKLIERCKELHIDTEEIVYSVSVEDILWVIADMLDGEALKLTLPGKQKQLEELIEKGRKAADFISWSEPLQMGMR